MIPDEKSRLRKIEHELYTSDTIAPKARGVMHERKLDTSDDWEHKEEAMHFVPIHHDHSLFKKIFFGSLGIFALAVIVFLVSFLTGGNTISSNRVDVTITAKSFVDGGETLPVTVAITNRNRLPLELATLVLEYPEGNADNPDAMTRINRDIGIIGSGDEHDETFSVQLYGQEGVQKPLTARLEFRVSGSNAVYDKEQTEQITIRTSPVRLTLNAPETAIPNQEVPLKFSIVGNGTETIPNTALIAVYPPEFTFARSNPEPSFGNNVWYLGDVAPGGTREITVYGSFRGSVGGGATIRASVGSQNATRESVLDRIYNTLAQVVPLSNAFIDARIVVRGQSLSTVPVSAGESISVTIPWNNTTASRITNGEIIVKLSGSAYDPERVQPGNGYFNSTTNEIVWTRQQLPELGSIDPGGSNQVNFTISPKQFAGTASNPSITISVDVRGIETGGAARSAMGIAKTTLVVASDLNLLARTIHYSGPIQNTGAMPPKVNQETTYTMEWQLTNSRNRVTNVQVKALLPLGVSWKNVIVPQTEIANVNYNSVTREIVWEAGDVSAGVSKIISMKVSVTPSANQIGSTIPLTDLISVSGRDTFTNTDIKFTKRGLDTRLLNDSSDVGAQGQVVQ